MAYPPGSQQRRFLEGDPAVVGQVIRWTARIIGLPRFRTLRHRWEDLHQEALRRITESLQRGRFDSSRDLRTYVQGVARFTALSALAERQPGDGPPSGEWEAGQVPAPGDPSRTLVARELARKVLEAASPRCRLLLRAYFL